MDYAAVVREAVRKTREEIGRARGSELSQPEFGALIGAEMGQAGFSKQAVINWEKGHSNPDAAVLLACARLAGVGLDELLRAASTEWLEAIHEDSIRALRAENEEIRATLQALVDRADSATASAKGSRNIVGKSPLNR